MKENLLENNKPKKRYKIKKILHARLFGDGNGIDGDMMYRKFVVDKKKTVRKLYVAVVYEQKKIKNLITIK